jgi:hypothetical protein
MIKHVFYPLLQHSLPVLLQFVFPVLPAKILLLLKNFIEFYIKTVMYNTDTLSKNWHGQLVKTMQITKLAVTVPAI